jgi:putative transposase
LIVEKIAYTLANPVAAALVRNAHEWPGAKTVINDIGNHSIQARRPDKYFRANNPKWARNAKLRISLPPSILATDTQTFRDDIKSKLTILEAAAHAVIPKHKVLGAKRATQVPPSSRITSHQLICQHNPTFAVGRGNTRKIRQAPIVDLSAFHTSYRNALRRWRAGDRFVVFPAGTYAMRVFHGANVAR